MRKAEAYAAAILLLRGMFCPHGCMRYCYHPVNCGHLVCPDCGLSWDEAAGR